MLINESNGQKIKRVIDENTGHLIGEVVNEATNELLFLYELPYKRTLTIFQSGSVMNPQAAIDNDVNSYATFNTKSALITVDTGTPVVPMTIQVQFSAQWNLYGDSGGGGMILEASLDGMSWITLRMMYHSGFVESKTIYNSTNVTGYPYRFYRFTPENIPDPQALFESARIYHFELVGWD